MDILISFSGQACCLVWPDTPVAYIHHCQDHTVFSFLLLGVNVEKAIRAPAASVHRLLVYPAVYRARYCGFVSVSHRLWHFCSNWAPRYLHHDNMVPGIFLWKGSSKHVATCFVYLFLCNLSGLKPQPLSHSGFREAAIWARWSRDSSSVLDMIGFC